MAGLSLQEGLGPPSRLILVLGSEIVPLDGVQLFDCTVQLLGNS